MFISRTAEDDRLDAQRRRRFLGIQKPRRSRTFYHVTEHATLLLIRAQGLKPSTDGNAGPGVYLYDDPEWAMQYAGRFFSPVLLRTRSTLPVHSAERIKDLGWAKRLGKDIPDDTGNLEHVWVLLTETFWHPRRMDVAPLIYDCGLKRYTLHRGGWKPLERELAS
jgi:hypothetical protein